MWVGVKKGVGEFLYSDRRDDGDEYGGRDMLCTLKPWEQRRRVGWDAMGEVLGGQSTTYSDRLSGYP